MEHAEGDAVQLERGAAPRGPPADPGGFDLVQEAGIGRVGHLRRGVQHHARPEAVEDRGRAAQMIEVAVGKDDHFQRANPVPREERRDHAAAGIGPGAARAEIDEQPPSGRRADCRAVALAHVEKM